MRGRANRKLKDSNEGPKPALGHSNPSGPDRRRLLEVVTCILVV